MSDGAQSTSATSIKNVLLEGTATFEEIGAALGVTTRTVYRLGLPFFIVGGKRRAVLTLARERLLARQTSHELPSPRRPGKPRKDTAQTR
jgi:hypothetical protein